MLLPAGPPSFSSWIPPFSMVVPLVVAARERLITGVLRGARAGDVFDLQVVVGRLAARLVVVPGRDVVLAAVVSRDLELHLPPVCLGEGVVDEGGRAVDLDARRVVHVVEVAARPSGRSGGSHGLAARV